MLLRNLLFPFLIFNLLIFNACSDSKNAGKDNFVIRGTLFNAKEATIYLEELALNDRLILDSTKIDKKGDFFFKYKPDKIAFYILKLSNNNFVTLLIDKGETVVITGDARELANSYEIEGSEGSALIKQINSKLRDNYKKVDSLRTEFENSKYLDNFLEIKANLDSIYFEIIKDQKTFIISFIDNNPESLASIIALYQTFGQEPVLSEKEDFIYFEKLAESLIKKYPSNPHSQDLYKKVEEIRQFLEDKKKAQKRLKEGNPAPEIELNNTDGTPVSLTSLKGKYVLIDFWASWCAPCRQANPKLKKIYNKYKNIGFEIYAVAFEREKQAWINAINMDKIDWINVSDLLYWQSPIAKLYDIETIPHNFLIDKQGNILQRNIELDDLDKFLRTAK